jgi:hypothetical protein
MKVELEQKNRFLVDGTYAVTSSITYSEGIDSNLFVYNTDTQAYSHIAFPYDMNTYPVSLEPAQVAGSSYYRVASNEKIFADVVKAEEFALYVRTRINWLVTQYVAECSAFESTINYTFEGV